jgi:hypothetical protein
MSLKYYDDPAHEDGRPAPVSEAFAADDEALWRDDPTEPRGSVNAATWAVLGVICALVALAGLVVLRGH